MKKYFKLIWFYSGLITLIFVIIISGGEYSDFELGDNTSTIIPISFASKTNTLSGTLNLSNQNNTKVVAMLFFRR